MKKIIVCLLLTGLSIGLHACIFKDLRQELETVEGRYAITGQVVDHEQAKGPILAALILGTNGQRTIQQIVFTEPLAR